MERAYEKRGSEQQRGRWQMLLLQDGWCEGAPGGIQARRQAGSGLQGRGCELAGGRAPGRGFTEAPRPEPSGAARLSAPRQAVALRRRLLRPAVAEEGPETGGWRQLPQWRLPAARKPEATKRRAPRPSSLPAVFLPFLARLGRQEWAPTAAGPTPRASRRPQQSEGGRLASHHPSPQPSPAKPSPPQIPGKKMRETGLELSSQSSSSSSGRGRVFRRFLLAARTRWQRPRRGAEPGLGGAACWSAWLPVLGTAPHPTPDMLRAAAARRGESAGL